MATMIEELNLKFHLILVNFHVNSCVWLMVTVLHRAGLDSPQMCSKSLNGSLVVVHRSLYRLHSHFSPFLPSALGRNEILHFSKLPCFQSLGILTPLAWDSFPPSVWQIPTLPLGLSLAITSLTSCHGPLPPCLFLFQVHHLWAL